MSPRPECWVMKLRFSFASVHVFEEVLPSNVQSISGIPLSLFCGANRRCRCRRRRIRRRASLERRSSCSPSHHPRVIHTLGWFRPLLRVLESLPPTFFDSGPSNNLTQLHPVVDELISTVVGLMPGLAVECDAVQLSGFVFQLVIDQRIRLDERSPPSTYSPCSIAAPCARPSSACQWDDCRLPTGPADLEIPSFSAFDCVEHLALGTANICATARGNLGRFAVVCSLSSCHDDIGGHPPQRRVLGVTSRQGLRHSTDVDRKQTPLLSRTGPTELPRYRGPSCPNPPPRSLQVPQPMLPSGSNRHV